MRFTCNSGRFDRFWCNGSLVGYDKITIRTGFTQPIPSINCPLPKSIIPTLTGLFNRVGRQPQINRTTRFIAQPCAFVWIAFPISLQVIKAPFHNYLQFICESRFECGKPILGHANQWRANRLMCTPFRCKCDTRRCAYQDETGILIARIVQRIQPPCNEWIIDCSDRDKPFPPETMAQPCCPQKKH